jgi:hypothetical protein
MKVTHLARQKWPGPWTLVQQLITLPFLRKSAFIEIKFTTSCMYRHMGNDQDDINKVIMSVDKDSLFGQNKNEHGIGWRYVPELHKFEILEYWRNDGNISFRSMKFLEVNETYKFYFIFEYRFKKFSWFGGTFPAPHYMYYWLKYRSQPPLKVWLGFS